MRIIRIILSIPLFLVGGYLALVSLLVSCTMQSNGMARGSITQWFLFSQGLPNSLGTWVVGALGMILIGCGYAVAAGGSRQ